MSPFQWFFCWHELRNQVHLALIAAAIPRQGCFYLVLQRRQLVVSPSSPKTTAIVLPTSTLMTLASHL
jgi:hypothetical protein